MIYYNNNYMSKSFTKKSFTVIHPVVKSDDIIIEEKSNSLIEYSKCNLKSNIIFNHTKYITIYNKINPNEAKVFYKKALGDKRITYPMLHYPVIKDYYCIILTSKDFDDYPFIHTINLNLTEFMSSYYTGTYSPKIKYFIDNIRKCYQYFTEDNNIENILCDLTIFSCDFNPNIIMFLEELLKEFDKLVMDIKFRDIKKEGYSDEMKLYDNIIALVKYNIRLSDECKKRLIIDGYNNMKNLMIKSLYL